VVATEVASHMLGESDLRLMATTPVPHSLAVTDAALRTPAVPAGLPSIDKQTDNDTDNPIEKLRSGLSTALQTLPTTPKPLVYAADDTYFDPATGLWYEERRYRICRVTAYCDRGTTAAGVPSGLGQCAAPGDIPLGSKVYIPALDRTFVVTDRTHRRFRNSTVDLFIPCEKECRQFGRKFLECEFHIVQDEPRYGALRVTRLP
jgi:3D (Asp-Asp-Asp) domain-containing protein